MKALILLCAAALLCACSAAPTSQDCTCTFNGKTYRIVQNAKGAVYGVPIK